MWPFEWQIQPCVGSTSECRLVAAPSPRRHSYPNEYLCPFKFNKTFMHNCFFLTCQISQHVLKADKTIDVTRSVCITSLTV